MIDVSFMGRETAKHPIIVRSVKEIEHASLWGAWRSRVLWALTGILIAGSVMVLIVLVAS